MKTLIAVSAVLLGATALSAQSLEKRVADARGTVGFEYDVKFNVCGNGRSIFISDDTSPGWTQRSRRSGTTIGHGNISSDRQRCELGSAHIVLEHSGSKVTSVSLAVASKTDRADTELGVVTPAEASRFLLSIAPALSSSSAEDAITGAAVADTPLDWRRLLAIARDNDATEKSRKASLFWVSMEAGTAATAGLSEIANDDDGSASVRSDALFYLSQRKNGDGVPALIKVVRESKSPRLRKDAIWFLSQSRDPRALDLFEKILSGK